MRQVKVAQIIEWQGGITWLKNIKPETLFMFLEHKLATKVRKTYPNTNDGWMLSLDEVHPEKKMVTGYYYRIGEWPVCYLGKLEYRFGRWDFAYITEIDSPPMMEEFAQQVFDLEKESEVDL